MLTISKPISSAQAREYHRAEFTNAGENYYTEEDRVRGEWHGRLAGQWGLTGEVSEEHFAKLAEGQHPLTGEQLVAHQVPRNYFNSYGDSVRTMEHRAGWDATFSAPKTVSLSALVGGDQRILVAHRESVDIALNEMERYVQARIGGSIPAETTGRWIAARFEHDSSRPVNGYSAPQLHTHVVIFNVSETEDGKAHALQPQELFRTQRYATAVYRAELAIRLKELGYEIERGEHGSPEIKGYSKEYVEASSPRRQQIMEHLAEHGVSGAEAAQIAAQQTREKKVGQSREEVLGQHQTMAKRYGDQPTLLVSQARTQVRQEYEEQDVALAGKSMCAAVNRNIEREAVIRERVILTDALRHGMGFLRLADVRDAFAESIEKQEIIEVEERSGIERAFTTPEMKSWETAILQRMTQEMGRHEELVPASIRNAVLLKNDHLNENQRHAVQVILSSRDQMMGLEGSAGTGKTTALQPVCEAAKQAGYHVEGLAPTSRAALNLEDAEISTKTLARHLAESQTPASGTKHLYVVDESSMASTRQFHDFVKRMRHDDRVLLVGDTRQHEAVEAGRPYAQLQEAGMQSAHLTEIIRQKDDGLKAAVKHLSAGEVETAIQQLRDQGRVHEYEDRQGRIQAIAEKFLEQPMGTLVISPDNESRVEIARKIHQEMQNRGLVKSDEQAVKILVARQDITSEDRLWARTYDPGDILRYTRGNKTLNIAARETVRVISTNDDANQITVERQSGEQITYDPRRVNGITSHREVERQFAEGDRIQFTRSFHPQRVANRGLGTVEKIDKNGDLVLKMDSGRRVGFNLEQHRHLDYGYAVTSHSSQGETVDRVLIHVDSEHVHKGLINARMAYVAVSRARFDAQIFTNDAESLGWELGRDVSHSSALRREEVKQLSESFNRPGNEHSASIRLGGDGAAVGQGFAH